MNAVQFEKHLLQKSRATRTPLKATLELSPLCNMNCKMCYVNESKKNIDDTIKDTDYWISIIPDLVRMGTLFTTLIGGEPFLYSGINRIYNELQKNGLFVSITTNGTLLADGLPEWLIVSPPKYLTVSLYGMSDSTYEKVTGNPKGYSQVRSALGHILQTSIPVQLNYCTLPENREDLQAALELAKEYRIPINASHYCYPNNARRDNIEYERLSPQEAASVFWDIKKSTEPANYEKSLRYYAAEEFIKLNSENLQKVNCDAGVSKLWISWNGCLSGCGVYSDKTIEIQPGALAEAWSELVEHTNNIMLSEECANCDRRAICSICPASLYTETNGFDKAPQYVCDIVDRIIIEAKRRL